MTDAVCGKPMKLFERYSICLLFALLAALWTFDAKSQQSSHPHLDPIGRTVWADERLGLRFTYPPAWKIGTATQASTRVVINWRAAKSKTLTGSCYLEAHGSDVSKLALIDPSQIHANAEAIAQSALKNFRQRAPNAKIVDFRSTNQDGHPVIFLVREGTIENFDRKTNLKAYSIQTVWNKTEVNFECATPIFGPDYASVDGGAKVIAQVEEGLMHVLRTLQFDRIAK